MAYQKPLVEHRQKTINFGLLLQSLILASMLGIGGISVKIAFTVVWKLEDLTKLTAVQMTSINYNAMSVLQVRTDMKDQHRQTMETLKDQQHQINAIMRNNRG